MKIYKSCTKGMTDEQFKVMHTQGLTTYISFDRMMKQSIGSELRNDERIVGMVIDRDGVQLYLEKLK